MRIIQSNLHNIINHNHDRMRTCENDVFSRSVTRVPRVQEVESSNYRPTKYCMALQTVRHHFNIYAGSCVALAQCRGNEHRKLVTRFGVIRDL